MKISWCRFSVANEADARARNWKRRGAWRGAYIPSNDVTVGYHCAVLLSKFVKVQKLSGFGSGFPMDIDVPADDWVDATHFYDALVFNTGHWWGFDKSPQELPLVFCKQGRPILPSLGIREGLAEVVKSILDFIDNTVPANVLKVWRLQSPRHSQSGEWNRNGSCSSGTLLNNTQVKDHALPSASSPCSFTKFNFKDVFYKKRFS